MAVAVVMAVGVTGWRWWCYGDDGKYGGGVGGRGGAWRR
ncbi:hypothetical protein Tco_0855071, partial [Tanacetum coccineum]